MRNCCANTMLLGLALLVAGCDREQVKSYSVPKETAATPTPSLPPGHPPLDGAAAGAMPPGGEVPLASNLRWKTPEGWQERPPGGMRAASFLVSGSDARSVDVSVIPLSGRSGTEIDNVNRWRGQVGLEPIAEGDLVAQSEAVHIGDVPARLYNLVGAAAGAGDGAKTRILAAMVRRGDTAWFFKAVGDAVLTEQEKGRFIELLKSVSFVADAASGGPTPATATPGASAASATPGAATAAPATAPATAPPAGVTVPAGWKVPAGWTAQPPAQFQTARFTVSGEGAAQAEVSVSELSGDGGGTLANVNRWRGQLGLAAATEAELATLTKPLAGAGPGAVVVDLVGQDRRTNQKTRMVAAAVPRDGATWFFKLMGDEALVEREQAGFTQFIRSIHPAP